MSPEPPCDLVEALRSPAAPPADAYIEQRIEAQAARTPSATAVRGRDRHLTYETLNACANQLAHHLIARGIGPEQVVGVALPRSAEVVVALLAIQKTGAVYLPLDPDYPAARLAFLIGIAAPACVLTTTAYAATLPAGTPLVVLDETSSAQRIAAAAAHDPRDADRIAPVHPAHAAHVFYTSGSTGVPKGVLVERRALARSLDSLGRVVRVAPGDRHLAMTTPSFDPSLVDFLLPLCRGAEVIVADTREVHDPAALAALIVRHRATSLQATPSYWALLVPEHAEALRGLGLLSMGEPLPRGTAARLQPIGREVWNLYGPTETTIFASAHPVSAGDVAGAPPSIVSIGRPLVHYALYVLDGSLRPVPAGVTGELYIAGSTLARGYLNQSGLTALRFVANPYGAAGSRMYRTGDLARWSRDGRFECLGRTDHQVKLRGFRIELGEIEQTLRAHVDVADAVVTLQGDGEDKLLVGYVLRRRPVPVRDRLPTSTSASDVHGDAGFDANGNSSPDADESAPFDDRVLRDHVRQRLPEYMTPSAIVALRAWPLTPGGKVDRKALPPVAPAAAAASRAPRTAQEASLCALYAQVLGVERVGIDDDFFELGGHSLMAMRLIARINDALGVTITARDIFERRTVAALSAVIERMSPAPRADAPPPVERINRRGPLPVSFNQDRYLVYDLWARSTGKPLLGFQTAVRFKLSGAVDRDAVERTLNEIVRRHEVLRTGFTSRVHPLAAKWIVPAVQRIVRVKRVQKVLKSSKLAGGSKPNGIFRQRIVPAARVPLRVLDVSGRGRIEQIKACWSLPELTERFDLARPPLIRAVLLTLGAQEHLLVVVLSHLVFDWWSEIVLRREFNALYHAFARREPSPLGELAMQYVDWAAWERKQFTGDRLERCIAYWQRELPEFSAFTSPLSVTELPYHRRAAAVTNNVRSHTIAVDAQLAARLRHVCAAHGVTMSMLLLAVLAVLLSRASGKDRIVLWIHFANRATRESQDLIGWFQQMLLVSFRLTPGATCADALRHAQEATVGAMAHHMPLELFAWRQTFDIPKDLAGAPPHIFFDMRESTGEVGLDHQPSPAAMARVTRKGDQALLVTGVREGDRLNVIAHYSLDWFTDETASEMFESYHGLLRAFAERPSTPIADLRLGRG